MHEARERLLAGSQVILTNSGPIEYATVGDGYPVLVVHGAGGGYDQGLILAQFAGDDFCRIAISRFGYLRTPLPANASPAAMADAYADLSMRSYRRYSTKMKGYTQCRYNIKSRYMRSIADIPKLDDIGQ
jgi:pimeloyl-ACP methyl ester carboxylesterase